MTRDVLRLGHEDLACYATAVRPDFELAPHHRIITDRLEAAERGDIRRLAVLCPPRHGKTLLATVLFAAWYLGRHPDRSIISASYSQELADDFGRQVRNFAQDSRHTYIFPNFSLCADASSVHRFATNQGGSYYAVGRGGSLTGRGCNLLLLDDLIKDYEEAHSETTRRNLFLWYQTVALTRLQPGAAIVLVQTRWHQDDLPGRLLRERPEDWCVERFPAIAEKDEGFRRQGEALWPSRYSLSELIDMRARIGAGAFACLYQQQPAMGEGIVFKREWWQYYREAPRFRRIVQSWDTGFKVGSENDFSVCTTWGVTDTMFYLLAFWRGKLIFPELKRKITSLAGEYGPMQILIEDHASGQSLIQELKYRTALPIIPVKVDRDKMARAHAVTPLIEAGRVFLPETAPWLNDFVDELSAFPNALHDDATDSTTQALNYVRHQPVHTVSFHTVYL